MNPITFPGLGITVHIQRVAFSFFGKDIYWYGILIAFGFLLGTAFSYRQCRHLGVQSDDLLDMLLFAAPIGIICARIYYVLFYLDLYTDSSGHFNWAEAIAIWDGGIAIYGGIIGAVITCFLFCRVKKISFPSMVDACSYGLLIGQSIGRWGNFINQEAHGGPCSAPWRMGITPPNGSYMEVHPTFLYESLWNALGLAILYFFVRKHRKFDGMLFCCYLLWYGIGRFFIEGLRTDSLYFFQTGIRVSQLVALLTAGGAVLILLVNLRKKNRETSAAD